MSRFGYDGYYDDYYSSPRRSIRNEPPSRPRFKVISPTISRGSCGDKPVCIVFVPASIDRDLIHEAHRRVFGRSPTRICDCGKKLGVGLAIGDQEISDKLIARFDEALSKAMATA